MQNSAGESSNRMANPNPPVTPKIDLGIESLRILAITCIVIYHAQIFTSDTPPFIRILTKCAEPVRLPLFSVVSGWVFSIRPLSRGREWPFLLGKARRILIPMVTITFMIYLTRPYTAEQVSLKGLIFWHYFSPPGHTLWFLHAIFMVFVTYVALIRINVLDSVVSWAVVFAASLGLLWFRGFDYYPFWGYFYLFPFFTLGVGLQRFSNILMRPWLRWPCLIVVVVDMFLFVMTLNGKLSIGIRRGDTLILTMGICGIWLLLHYRNSLPNLSPWSKYVYVIFLFHFEVIMAITRLMKYLQCNSGLFALIFVSIFSMMIPALFEKITEKLPVVQLILFGKKVPRS